MRGELAVLAQEALAVPLRVRAADQRRADFRGLAPSRVGAHVAARCIVGISVFSLSPVVGIHARVAARTPAW